MLSPATGSPTATLLRLRPDRRPHYQTRPMRHAARIRASPSSKAVFPGVTGGVYKARALIHRAVVIRDY